MSHGRAQPRHRRRKSDFFGSPAKQSIDAPPVAAPEAVDDEWVRCHDAATGASYYANRRSFEVSWTPPTAAVSPPAAAASAPAPPPPVVAAEASVAAPPPARPRRAADAAWIGRGATALAKATLEAPTPVVAPPPPPAPEPPSPPTPEPVSEPSPPEPEAPPTPEPDDEPSYEEFVVVDERTDSGTEEGSGASYEEFEEVEEVDVAPEPSAPPTPEPAESLYEEEFVVVDERTDSGTDEGGSDSYEEFEEIEEVVVAPEPAAEAPAAPAEPTPEPQPDPTPEPSPSPPEPAPAPTAPPARRKTAQELLAALAEVSERLAPYAAAFAPAPRKGGLLGPRGAPTRRGRALLAAARRCQAPA